MSDTSPKNKNKKKNSNDSKNITINIHETESDDTLNPCIAIFPLNFPNINIINNQSETEWKIGQNKNRNFSNDKSLLGINSRIIYEARNKAQNLNRSNYVIGIINKKHKREIDFYDIDTIFNINQKIRKIENIDKKISENIEVEEEYKGVDKNEMMAQLGTSKAKRQAISTKENVVKENNIFGVNAIKQAIKEKTESSENKKNEEEQKNSQLALFEEILPKFDINTKKVENIFEYSSIIENEKVKEIDHKNVLKLLIKNGEGLENNKKNFSLFIYEYLKSLVPKINDGKNLSNKIKYSIFLNDLIKFYLLPKVIRENPEKLTSKFNLDVSYIKIMLNNYTTVNVDNGNKVTYMKNPNLILKNIYHIICLALLLNWFEFDYSTLATSLRMDNKQMTTYFKEIGCTLSNKNTTVKLTAPLKLNLTTKNLGKRRKK